MNEITKLYGDLAALNQVGMFTLRAGLVVVLLWIGGLKFAKYEGESIVPLVSNSPMMGFFYRFRAPDYRAHMNKEGELNLPDRAWNATNGTYRFSHGLGIVIMLIGIMIALSPLLPQIAAIGSLLLALMSCTTPLSSLRLRRPGFLQRETQPMAFRTSPDSADSSSRT